MCPQTCLSFQSSSFLLDSPASSLTDLSNSCRVLGNKQLLDDQLEANNDHHRESEGTPKTKPCILSQVRKSVRNSTDWNNHSTRLGALHHPEDPFVAKQFAAAKNNSQVSMAQDSKCLFLSRATCLSQLGWEVCSTPSSLRSTDWRSLLTQNFNNQRSKEKERSSDTQAHGGFKCSVIGQSRSCGPFFEGSFRL